MMESSIVLGWCWAILALICAFFAGVVIAGGTDLLVGVVSLAVCSMSCTGHAWVLWTDRAEPEPNEFGVCIG